MPEDLGKLPKDLLLTQPNLVRTSLFLAQLLGRKASSFQRHTYKTTNAGNESN